MAPDRAMRYEARRNRTGYEVLEEGDPLIVAPTAELASDAVYVRAYRRAFELASLKGWVRVHGATVDLDGARVLLVGPSGAGKTTLALRLLLDGAAVQGDESVLVRADARSLPVPRAIHVKAGTEQLLPELRPLLSDAPRTGDVAVLDPRAFNPRWRLAEAPVDHVVLIERTGGAPACTDAASGEIVEVLAHETFPVTEAKAALVRTLAGAISSARRHRLSVGDPAATIAALQAAIR
jgi:hypothetical protein